MKGEVVVLRMLKVLGLVVGGGGVAVGERRVGGCCR